MEKREVLQVSLNALRFLGEHDILPHSDRRKSAEAVATASQKLQECLRAPARTPVTLTQVVTVATGVRSAVQTLDKDDFPRLSYRYNTV